MTEDLLVLQHANARIEELVAELREALHTGLPLRRKMELVEEMSRQFDLAGEHDAARKFRQWCDSMVILRDMQEEREEHERVKAERRARRWRWLRRG